MPQRQQEIDDREYVERTHLDLLIKQIFLRICREQPEDVGAFIIETLDKLKAEELLSPGSLYPQEPTATPLARRRRNAVSAPAFEESDVRSVANPKTEHEKLLLTTALKGNSLFQHVDEADRQILYDFFILQSFPVGSVIIEQGAAGDYFYVVHSGVCEVYKEEEDGSRKKVTTLGPGASFGELALMYGVPRAASVYASSDVQVWALDGGIYRKVLMEASIQKRRNHEEFLKKVPILDNLSDWERSQLADALEYCEVEDGTVIVKQGDPGDCFYFIKEGTCSIHKLVGDENVCVGQLREPAYFGEMALMSSQPRAATITAIGRVALLKLDRSLFDLIVGPCEELLQRGTGNYVSYPTS
ncbi:hypothetical protein RCL1_006384 [Eukaryota sp. TZLM3-RCL]